MSGDQIEEALDIDDVEGFTSNDYMVYVFEKGTFVLNGDGGFNNFVCSGEYSKTGNRYKFTSPM